MATNDKQWLVSYHALQQLVGCIAVLMAVAVRLWAYGFDGVWWSNSISAYYWTSARDVLVGCLVVGGIVLAFYRSDFPQDKWIAMAAGAAAVGIALFPMEITVGMLHWPVADEAARVDALLKGVHGPIGMHRYCAAVFFGLVFWLVAFRFSANTATAKDPAKKRQRNFVYRVCAAVMAICMAWIAVLWAREQTQSIYLPETIAIMAFAFAWLVKGQRWFADQQQAALPITDVGDAAGARLGQ